MILFDMPLLCQLTSNFACDLLCMSSFAMNFCGNFWAIFYLIGIFACCLDILGFCLSDWLPCLVKCSYHIIWMWNFMEWFITCSLLIWLWSHSFLNCSHWFMNFWSECMCWYLELAWIIVSGFLDFHWPTSFCPIELKIDMLFIGYVLFRLEFLWN